MDIATYTKNTEAAIFSNPPRNQGTYQDDPIAVWRYYMRLYGAGLGIYSEKEVHDTITSLYSGWFVRLEFHSHMPKIDNKEFIGWIMDARREAMKRKE